MLFNGLSVALCLGCLVFACKAGVGKGGEVKEVEYGLFGITFCSTVVAAELNAVLLRGNADNLDGIDLAGALVPLLLGLLTAVLSLWDQLHELRQTVATVMSTNNLLRQGLALVPATPAAATTAFFIKAATSQLEANDLKYPQE